MDLEARAELEQLRLQVHLLQERVDASKPLPSQLKETSDRLAEQAGRSQELAAKVLRLELLLAKAVEAADANTSAFRDIIQIMDAKSCVQEAIIRDLADDAARFEPTSVKRTADGQLDVATYFDRWKQKLVEEEAKADDPYEGAVMFGGDYNAQVDGTPEQDPARRDGGGAG
jgi:hypothetical protein